MNPDIIDKLFNTGLFLLFKHVSRLETSCVISDFRWNEMHLNNLQFHLLFVSINSQIYRKADMLKFEMLCSIFRHAAKYLFSREGKS